MDADYLQAAIPEPVRLLGQDLEDLSLGHLKLLRRFNNAFTQPEPRETIGDLVMAVFICCQTYEAARAGLRDPKTTQRLAKWGRKLGQFDFTEKAKIFRAYIAEGSLCPKMHEPDNTGRFPGSPFIQRVQLILQGQLNHTLSEALNKPWGEALYDYFGFWEMEGRLQLFSHEDAEHLEAVAKLRAEIEAEIKEQSRDGQGAEIPTPLQTSKSENPDAI